MRWLALALFLSSFSGALAATPPVLPIYLEDSHAGSFFHLAETLDLDEPHALVLVDMHTDASAVPRSDQLRDGLRRVRSARERGERLEKWRRDGAVQAFDWIEPLMPLPFAGVWWVAPDSVTESEKDGRQFLDGRLDTNPRRCGKLGERFHKVAFDDLADSLPAGMPVIASVDLDYFAAMSDAQIAEEFAPLWEAILSLPHLSAVTFCVSRPWLRDDPQALLLCERALTAALSLRNATVAFEPFAPEGPDRSERAREFYQKSEVPPRLDIAAAPSGLRSLLLANADRLVVRYENERWEKLLADWRLEAGAWRIVADGAQPSTDGIWRMREPVALRVSSEPRQSAPERVRWISMRPEKSVYNVLPELPGSKAFAQAAPPLVRDVETRIAESGDGALAAQSWAALLDARTGWGSVRIAAEVLGEDGAWQRTPAMELRVFEGDGFRAGLSEQFGLPYVFGAGFLRQGGETGPETLAGNDCANFLIYAWRRAGHRLRWGDPVGMARQLRRVAVDLDADSQTPIPPGSLDRGLAIHAGQHAAAVWEDREPIGLLDGGDIVAHHLSATPELITLRELLKKRPVYHLYEMPKPEMTTTLVIGGDVALHSVGSDPFAKWPGSVKNADVAVVNLECALTEAMRPAREKTFLLKAKPEAAEWLRSAGIDAVSLANNHARDFGDHGYADTVAALGDIGHFGTKSWTVDEVAFFGINLIENDEVEADLETLERGMSEAATAGKTVIVMPHWGAEYTDQTTPGQREMARWLVDRGADVVAGAHPHHRQPLDFFRGRPIFYSLGNAFFPGEEGPAGFHEAGWARLGLSSDGRVMGARQTGNGM